MFEALAKGPLSSKDLQKAVCDIRGTSYVKKTSDSVRGRLSKLKAAGKLDKDKEDRFVLPKE